LRVSISRVPRLITASYQLLGRKETIDLLDRMKETGFRESTRSGLSFAASDLRPPANKDAILKDKDKEVEKLRKQFERGFITEAERYNKVLEQWGEARDKITGMLMEALKHDRRKDLTT